MKERCLITGASGAIGPAVVEAFVHAGYSVSVYNRNKPVPSLFSPKVKVLVGDVTDVGATTAAVEGSDIVIHLASLLHVNDPTAACAQEMQRVNVTGTSVVVEASRVGGVKRVVLGSTIAVYGYGQPGTLTEASVTSPETVYGRTKLAAEEAALSVVSGDGSALSSVLRLAAVYGPRIKGNYQTLLRALEQRRFVPIGQGANRRTLVHTQDVARAILLVAEHEQAAGAIYNVTDGESPALREILEAMCDALARPYPKITVPTPLARTVGSAIDAICRLAGRRLSIGNLVEKYLEEVVVDGGKLQRELGFQPRMNLRRGWLQTVDELRARGLL